MFSIFPGEGSTCTGFPPGNPEGTPARPSKNSGHHTWPAVPCLRPCKSSRFSAQLSTHLARFLFRRKLLPPRSFFPRHHLGPFDDLKFARIGTAATGSRWKRLPSFVFSASL